MSELEKWDNWEDIEKKSLVSIVSLPAWQALREQLKGQWDSPSKVSANLSRLNSFAGSHGPRGKRCVQNYLQALRGLHSKYPAIAHNLTRLTNQIHAEKESVKKSMEVADWDEILK